MKVKVPEESDFTSRLRSPAVSARVGLWLGICFGIAFVTGLVSHVAQVAQPWVPFPTRPVWGYRVTQAVHVASGTAAIPLLLVKLWSVYPKLFTRPPRSVRELTLVALERGSIAVLVASAIFQLATGLANSAQWYAWSFPFVATHYAVAWVAVGALLVHVAVKLPVIRTALSSPVDSDRLDRAGAVQQSALSRRGLLRTTWAASAGAVLLTAGAAVPVLRRVSLFAVRSGEGPGGVPVNGTATARGVVAAALDPSYRLEVRYDGKRQTLSRRDLLDLPQTTRTLPIACVEGWSASGEWSGVRLRHLLDVVGAPRGRDVRVRSLQERGAWRETVLPANFADDEATLVALALAGEPLGLDHGYPCRLIAPNRPGVLQTKWLSSLEVL